jgi:hypothetical protein
MHYTGESEEKLRATLEEKYTKSKLPEYKILSIRKVADNLEQFRSLQAADKPQLVH